MSTQPQPRVFHTDLEGNYSEVEITLDDPPTFAFVRGPFNFTRPLPRDELRELAEGRFGADLDAQLRACTSPPAPPFSDADRERIVRLADEAWSAAAADHTIMAGAGAPPGAAPAASAADEELDADQPLPVPSADPASSAVTVVAATIVAPGELPASLAPPAPRRTLKVLLTLRPDGPDGYRALVGVGADGCDPHFGATDAPLPLAAALDAVPAIVAAAEARWLTAPRYPATARPIGSAATTKGAASPRAGAGKAAKPVAQETGTSTTVNAPVPEAQPAPAKPATKNQISLFG